MLTNNNIMDLKEFRDKGFLLEANRQFFHPLGLAIGVYWDKSDPHNATGTDTDNLPPIGLIVYDYRNDPEGVVFAELTEDDLNKAEYVKSLRDSKAQARIALVGSVVQPIDAK